MTIKFLDLVIGLLFTVIGGVIGILSYRRTEKKDIEDKIIKEANVNAEQIRHDTKIDVKLDNIARNVDETRLDIKDFNKTIGSLSERVTKVEESTKQAHKRIDSLEDLHLTK